VIRRFSLALISECEKCFFLDDDLLPGRLTLKVLNEYSKAYPDSIIGLNGVKLGKPPTPYTSGVDIHKPSEIKEVDILSRISLAPTKALTPALYLRSNNPHTLNGRSIDDILLSLGNKYLLGGKNYVIPSDEFTMYKELPYYDTGLSQEESHYNERNLACLLLMNNYHGKD
jgi:hypothetical protein